MCFFKKIFDLIKHFFRKILSFIFYFLVYIRNQFYSFLEPILYRAPCFIISVGNLSLGGTGKTPVVKLLASAFKKKQLKVVIICKGYKGSFKGVQRVKALSTDRESSLYFGDEPYMLFKRGGKEVWVCSDKLKALKAAIKKSNPDIAIIDDGFQHRKVRRDWDIVLIDPLASLPCRLIPEGLFREPLSALERAHQVIITRANLVSPLIIQEWLKNIYKFLPLPQHGKANMLKKEEGFEKSEVVSEASFYISGWINFFEQHKEARGADEGVLISGIGQPFSFEKMTSLLGWRIKKHFIFPDHHRFSAEDIEKVLLFCKMHSIKHLFITDKDALKIRDYFFYAKKTDTEQYKDVLAIYELGASFKDLLEEFKDKIWVGQLSIKIDPNFFECIFKKMKEVKSKHRDKS